MIKRSEMVPAIIGLLIAIAVSFVGHQWSQPAPIEFFQRSISETNVRGGDKVVVSWTQLSNDQCTSVVHRQLVAADKKITEFEVVKTNELSAGVERTGEFSFVVPVGLAEGPLIYRVHAEFRCNLVQQVLGGENVVFPDIVLRYSKG